MSAEITFHQRARQTQLIGLALDLVGEHGLEALSISSLARRAGVSRGVIGYNVGDLDDLIDGMVALVYERGRAAVLPAMATAPDPASALQAFVAGSLDFYAEQPGDMRALREIFSRRDHPRAATAQHARERADTAALLAAGQAAGSFAAFDVDLMADAVRAVLDVGAARIAHDGDDERLREEIAAVVDRMVGSAR